MEVDKVSRETGLLGGGSRVYEDSPHLGLPADADGLVFRLLLSWLYVQALH